MGKKQAQRRYANRPPERRQESPTPGSALKSLLTVLIPCLLVLAAGSYFLFMRGSDGMASPRPTATAARGASGSAGNASGSATSQNVSLPSYVQGPMMTLAYQFAVERPDVLDYVPCFCGCGQHSGHKSNKNCFVRQSGQTNGKVVFDEHGANCDMCVNIAVEAKRMTAEGKSVKEIRQYIEQKYGGSGPATDTPWPQA